MAVKKAAKEEEGSSAMERLRPSIQQLKDIKDMKDVLTLEMKKLNEQEEYLEGIIISSLRAEGLDSVKIIGVATAGVKDTVMFTVKNFDAALAWIIENHREEFLTKSLKQAALREAYEAKQLPPELAELGIEPFHKDSLSFRRINTSA